jgi:hypothetical protein
MIERPEELVELLRGTMLEGREVEVVDRAPSGDVVLAVGIESKDEV